MEARRIAGVLFAVALGASLGCSKGAKDAQSPGMAASKSSPGSTADYEKLAAEAKSAKLLVLKYYRDD